MVSASRARTEMVDACRTFLMIDPRLPAEVMPRDWPRTQAGDLFLTVYDGLAEPAQQYVRDVVEPKFGGVHDRIDVDGHRLT